MPALEIPKGFKKRLDKKAKTSPHLVAAILECVARLGDDPRHPGLHSKSVKGVPGVFESRVDGANRVTWEYGDDCIVLRNHCNHDIVTRSP
jgi:hypothetical protein